MSAIRSPAAPGRSRIYEKILREILRENPVESIADLAEAAKVRCVELRLPYEHGEINDALATIGDRGLGL